MTISPVYYCDPTADDDNIAYKVRGGFGEDKDDELIPETRWIRLSELVHNMDERSLIALDKWAGKHKAAKSAPGGAPA